MSAGAILGAIKLGSKAIGAIKKSGNKSGGDKSSGGGLLSKVAGAGGAAAGAGLGLATGLLQTLQANKLKRKAEASMPELVDPTQAAFLAELNQKRQSIETGADFAGGMAKIDATTAGTNDAILRNAGGDVSASMQALLQSASGANTAKNDVIAQGQQQQGQYNQMYEGMLNQISARKLQLQMYSSQQNRAEWAKKQQGASANLQAGLAGTGLIGAKPAQTASLPTATPVADPSVAAPTASVPTVSTDRQAAPAALPDVNSMTNLLSSIKK